MTDIQRRKLLCLPLPVDYKTNYCIVWLKIDYLERIRNNRFFQYGCFKDAIKTMPTEKIQEFVNKLQIRCKAEVLYFNSSFELEIQRKDLSGLTYYIRGQ